MAHTFPQFDRSRLVLHPLAAREHGLAMSIILPLQPLVPVRPELETVAARIAAAKAKKAAVVLIMGAHVLRSGVQRYLIDLMEQGYLSVIAMSGAGVIHDFEFALIGATTESVARYIQKGQFGLWQETGRINDIVAAAARDRLGLGEAVGRVIEEERFSHRDISVLAAGYRLGIPITVHVGIGYDIVHEHPNCDGAAYGATSYTDFLRFTKVLETLQEGVVMNFGSAVMAPEVFLKGLAMVRNVAQQNGGQISKFTTLVCDLKKLPEKYHYEASREDPSYYFRPWKTMLIRAVADGGESFYVQGPHAATIPQLWTAIKSANPGKERPI
ncbi:MAG: hypothetical protein A2Y80_09010 [Deltaproteobacteria bacterium RBG_13_58_19]|jgi:hypothetical protein|nr:MAG: hypothetical protein A2Y80_09010 [Deltaproteobacteria bacterium RBG_13_58_19]